MTIPATKGTAAETYLMSGYKPAGDRAIRIDMLERLADMLRAEDSRGGFEAKPDMLSITGMTLDQFANLMEGLGYKAAKGEREKVRATPEAQPEDDAPKPDAPEAPAKDATAEVAPEAPLEDTADTTPAPTEPAETEEPPAEGDTAAQPDGPEVEVFYTFTWGGQRQTGGKPQGKPRGKPKHKGKPRKDGGQKTRNFEARPPKKDKIDPDNPFAQALMGLKTGDK